MRGSLRQPQSARRRSLSVPFIPDATVYETDGVSSYLVLSQHDGTEIPSDTSKSRLYVQENGRKLRIYVPRDRKEQELCYFRMLPQRILDLIMTDPETSRATGIDPSAIEIIGNILRSSKLIVDDFLEEAGIIPCDVPLDGNSANDWIAQPSADQFEESPTDNYNQSTLSSRRKSSSGSSSGDNTSEPPNPTSSFGKDSNTGLPPSPPRRTLPELYEQVVSLQIKKCPPQKI
jgi:hypothetical protein